MARTDFHTTSTSFFTEVEIKIGHVAVDLVLLT